MTRSAESSPGVCTVRGCTHRLIEYPAAREIARCAAQSNRDPGAVIQGFGSLIQSDLENRDPQFVECVSFRELFLKKQERMSFTGDVKMNATVVPMPGRDFLGSLVV
jgi:hypothetical protein